MSGSKIASASRDGEPASLSPICLFNTIQAFREKGYFVEASTLSHVLRTLILTLCLKQINVFKALQQSEAWVRACQAAASHSRREFSMSEVHESFHAGLKVRISVDETALLLKGFRA